MERKCDTCNKFKIVDKFKGYCKNTIDNKYTYPNNTCVFHTFKQGLKHGNGAIRDISPLQEQRRKDYQSKNAQWRLKRQGVQRSLEEGFLKRQARRDFVEKRRNQVSDQEELFRGESNLDERDS